MVKGLIVCVAQLLVVSSLGAKLLYDRATRPRVWTRAAPYDPDLPIRGRYVSIQLEVSMPGFTPPTEEQGRDWYSKPVTLKVENDQLVAVPQPVSEGMPDYGGGNRVSIRQIRVGEEVPVLARPVAFFITEHVPDPARREAGEELWVEVTLPKKGPPRPIRLGVKKDGKLTPLELD